MYNNKRFKNKIDLKHKFLSMLSQSKNQWFYYSLCLAISTIIYRSVWEMTGIIKYGSGPMVMLVIFQTINFHHYIADAIIWKVRKKSIRDNLGV